jgi:hypothetical protein
LQIEVLLSVIIAFQIKFKLGYTKAIIYPRVHVLTFVQVSVFHLQTALLVLEISSLSLSLFCPWIHAHYSFSHNVLELLKLKLVDNNLIELSRLLMTHFPLFQKHFKNYIYS